MQHKLHMNVFFYQTGVVLQLSGVVAQLVSQAIK